MEVHRGWRLAAFDYGEDEGTLNLDLYYGFEGGGTTTVHLYMTEDEFEARRHHCAKWVDEDTPLIILSHGNIYSVREDVDFDD